MTKKYFTYDPDDGFELHDTEDKARMEAERILRCYAVAATNEGWDELTGQICWGELKQYTKEIKHDERVYFEGELCFCVDYKLTNIGE